jgi:type I restriction enzyme S subunit
MSETPNWQQSRLGDLAFIKTGSRNNQDKQKNGRYPFYVRSQDIERIDTYSYVDEAILIPGEGNIGSIVHYVNEPHEVHQRVYRISDFSSQVHPLYIYWYLREFFKAHTEKFTVKATVDSLRLPTFQDFNVHYPSLPEQKSIARALSDTEELIDNLRLEIVKLELMLEAQKDYYFSIKNTQSWKLFKIDEIGTLSTSTRKQSNFDSSSDFVILDMGSVSDKGLIIETKYTQESLDLLSVGDLIIPKDDIGGGNIIGKSVLVPLANKYVLGDHVFKLSVDRSLFSPDFTRYILNSKESNKRVLMLVAGSAQLGLPKSSFLNHQLLYPDLATQIEICEVLNATEVSLNASKQNLRKYECIKQGMAHDLLTGKVRLA